MSIRPVQVVIVAGVSFVLAAILFPVFAQSRGPTKMVCYSRLRQIATTSHVYVSDNDGRFPDAGHWCDALDPYIKTKDVHHCTECPGADYCQAMHDKMSHARLDKIAKPESQILFFESAARIRNAHGDESLIRRPGLHRNRSYVAYADGSVRSLWRGE